MLTAILSVSLLFGIITPVFADETFPESENIEVVDTQEDVPEDDKDKVIGSSAIKDEIRISKLFTWLDWCDGGHQCWGFASLITDSAFGGDCNSEWETVYGIDGVKTGDIFAVKAVGKRNWSTSGTI